MSASFEKRSAGEVARINRVQSDFFSGLIHVFDPPLPEGVPERLDRVVAAGGINEGDVVLDVGAGTGILIPFLERYRPERIYACDLSTAMLEHLQKKYPSVEIIFADVGEVLLPPESIDAVFINAAYPNIMDKNRAFLNLSKMLKTAGRLVISHPLGKSFVEKLKERSPFPLDEFPHRREAETLLAPYGLEVDDLVDDPELYLLTARKM